MSNEHQMTAKEKAMQTLTVCRDCVYGDCRNGICYSCSEWPGRNFITEDTFFCDKGLHREKAKEILKQIENERGEQQK